MRAPRSVQYDFCDPQPISPTANRWAAAFEAWVHSPQGRIVSDRFIRIAYGCNQRGIKMGVAAIWERMRWNFMLRKGQFEKYKLNNNYRAYMARFAMEREPTLKGYFEIRRVAGEMPPMLDLPAPVERASGET